MTDPLAKLRAYRDQNPPLSDEIFNVLNDAINNYDALKQRVKVLEEALDSLRAPCRRMFVPCGACVNCEITSRVIHLQKALAPPVGEKDK